MDTLEILKALADETRLRIINLLAAAGDLCACEVEALLGLNQSNASRHLTRLRSAGLVEDERRGHWIHFSLPLEHRDTDGIVAVTLSEARARIASLQRDLEHLSAYRRSGHSCVTIKEWEGPRQSSPS